MIDGQFVGVGEVDAAVEGAFHDCVGHVGVAGQFAFRQIELAHLIVKSAVVLVHLADHKRRHVVHEKLMQVIVADADQHVGLRLGKLLPHHGDSFFDLGGAGRLLWLFEQPRHERIVSNADDRNDLCHGLPPAGSLWGFYHGHFDTVNARALT